MKPVGDRLSKAAVETQRSKRSVANRGTLASCPVVKSSVRPVDTENRIGGWKEEVRSNHSLCVAEKSDQGTMNVDDGDNPSLCVRLQIQSDGQEKQIDRSTKKNDVTGSLPHRDKIKIEKIEQFNVLWSRICIVQMQIKTLSETMSQMKKKRTEWADRQILPMLSPKNYDYRDNKDRSNKASMPVPVRTKLAAKYISSLEEYYQKNNAIDVCRPAMVDKVRPSDHKHARTDGIKAPIRKRPKLAKTENAACSSSGATVEDILLQQSLNAIVFLDGAVERQHEAVRC